MNFPDLPHLRQLQKALWQWPKSRAAVMVGAGFSLNSEPLPGIISKFPTWQQLVGAMFDELYPIDASATEAEKRSREKQFLNANALRIASEYESSFGKQKLEQLIRRENPDAEHLPGILHTLLLELPWVDVFTTNYDTLLERTDIPRRAYQPVTKASDLTTAFSPRIIKLHGSFPSQSPFIISEEDYRTYPTEFAPFVNSVRQSLLENCFVLIGFSGDDPNFLAWTGWIRDELGGYHAPIYLVGLLGLRPATRALLARRGVTPIDLSPIFDGKTFPQGNYPHSLEWFLRSLAGARPARLEKWPDSNSDIPNEVAFDPPLEIGAASESEPQKNEGFPTPGQSLTNEKVRMVFERWRYERLHYPGWLVADDSKRENLYDATKHWIDPILHFTQSWSPADRITIYREINWRLETAMAPLFATWVSHFQKAITDLLPFLHKSGPSAVNNVIVPPLNSDDLLDSWLSIAFGILREAREMYDSERWKNAKTQIDQVVTQRPQFVDRNHYEAALWELWNINRPAAKSILAQWQPSPRLPVAAIWKASLLAELDELAEARDLLRRALAEIRKGLRNNGRNVELLSIEGWCTYLLYSIELSLNFTRFPSLRYEFGERWQELKAWDCSPWPVLEHFNSALSVPPPLQHKPERVIHDFDPGYTRTSYSMAGPDIESYLPAFACIRLFEQVGLPMHLQRVNLTLSNALAKACGWIAPFISFWSPALLIRAGDKNSIKDTNYLSRPRVAAMGVPLAERLFDWCLNILEREIATFSSAIIPGSTQESIVELLPEVISRLAFKANAAQLKRAFSLAMKYHALPAVRAHFRLHEVSEPWFRRLFDAADESVLLEWLPILIKAPLYDGSAPHHLSESEAWPDPMKHFPASRLEQLTVNSETPANIRDATKWLLAKASCEQGEARRRALERLLDLYKADLLTKTQRQMLGRLLWSKTRSSGMPDLPHYAVFSFLNLPAPESLNVVKTIKKHLLALPDRTFVKRAENGGGLQLMLSGRQELIEDVALATKPVINMRGEAKGQIRWSKSESLQLYRRARAWWAHDKEAAGKQTFIHNNPVLETLDALPRFLARAVLPLLEPKSPAWDEILSWFSEIRNLEVFPSVALPYFLIKRDDFFNMVANTVKADLSSDCATAVESAALALRHWLHLPVQQPPTSALDALVHRVIFRSKPGLVNCIAELTYIIVDKPGVLSKWQVGLLIDSLTEWHSATVIPVDPDASMEFSEEERPRLRVLIGRMAGALNRLVKKGKKTYKKDLAGLNLWEKSCSSDPTPEVRRAYTFWDNFAIITP